VEAFGFVSFCRVSDVVLRHESGGAVVAFEQLTLTEGIRSQSLTLEVAVQECGKLSVTWAYCPRTGTRKETLVLVAILAASRSGFILPTRYCTSRRRRSFHMNTVY
jgi:hypothetical protein